MTPSRPPTQPVLSGGRNQTWSTWCRPGSRHPAAAHGGLRAAGSDRAADTGPANPVVSISNPLMKEIAMTTVDRLTYAELAEREVHRRSQSCRVRVRGQKVPAWIWRALYDARLAGGDLPFVIVEDAGRELLVLDSQDWDAVLAALEPAS